MSSNIEIAETTAAVVGGIGTLATVLRYVIKTLKADKRDSVLVEAEIASIKRLKDEIEEAKHLCGVLSKKIAKLRAIELEGTSDIGVIGVYLDRLLYTECAGQVTCPRADVLNDVMEVYGRIEARRASKQKIYNEEMDIDEKN